MTFKQVFTAVALAVLLVLSAAISMAVVALLIVAPIVLMVVIFVVVPAVILLAGIALGLYRMVRDLTRMGYAAVWRFIVRGCA